ncbi:MAG TPA: YcnI family protein [Jatrophihabitans sp.]|nr:YcnI family protein [Jatrophihabitans sp.]
MKRLALVTVAALAALLALAVPASAHVTVTAPGATRGGSDQEITFRVPVEKNVATTGLTIALPLNTPLASVLVEPMPGWTHQQKSTKLAHPITTDDGQITEAVSEISWRAQNGQGLAPGEFGSFTIIAGLLPDAPSLTFKALQYYADGSVVKWIETAAPGSDAQPEDPAPVLQLGAATQAKATVSVTPTSSGSSSSSNTGPTVLSIIALVLAAGALGLAVTSRARRRG